ncbi:methyltransferase domain-containing protein [Phycicoccus sonneratiae]|uniref:Methyltransferase domain-containing protein n=1 Tax=Phycicoccus sonneratiae TaxID=2807628 RepID=A0ABS2CHK3_9MICO|nr:methyltransferase domain-containing protein [Phycicoccus sonneraticus]MBM6399285.1 methyltransferase domain-containing protein [Phycicoccus sonneraticus]
MTRYTHGHAEPVLRSHRWRTAANSAAHLLPHLRPGLALLDVGSGPGTITADLAALVAPGPVTALEATAEALALTAAELARRGVPADLVVGDVHELPFPDASFDVVHAHQVLQHVADPVRALAEMRRVCRPGGLVAARDADYAAFAWWPAAPLLDRWLGLYEEAARANGGEPDAGRRLLGWARAAGFGDPEVGASTWCFAAPADRASWGGMWADRITGSALADQLVREQRCTPAELDAIAEAWREWARAPDGWFVVVHGDLLARV